MGHGRDHPPDPPGANLTTLGAIVLVIVVVLAGVPAPILAQSDPAPPAGIMLDQKSTEVGSVTVDGTIYRVYRYENLLPYASGIEVYANGQQITDVERARPALQRIAARQTIRQAGYDDSESLIAESIQSNGDPRGAFQRVAWREAVGELDASDIETLQSIRSAAAEIEQRLRPVESILDRTVTIIDGLKDREVLGTSLWDAATRASPSLRGFEETVRTLQTEIEDWTQAARTIDENVPGVINGIERMESGEDVDYTRVARQFERTMTGLNQLQSESDELQSRLSGAAATSATIGSNVRDVPAVGGELASHFQEVSTTLEGAAGRIDSFSDTIAQQQSALQSVTESAERTRSGLEATYDSRLSTLENGMSARNSAELKVYGTGAGGALGAALVGFKLKALL